RDVKDVAQQYKYVMAAHGIVSSLAGLYGGVNFTQPNTNIGKPGNIVNKVDDIAGKGTASQVDKAVQTGNGNLPIIREGKVTYEPLAKPDANEIRAGQKFADLGYDVTYKATASDKGIKNVRTQDLWVSGIGKVDVITPKVITEKSMLRRIEEKNKQTTAVILQVDLSVKDMQSIASRTWGKPTANNINTLFFQNSKGQVIRFDRPSIRNK
ncbi:hypothetical protein B6D17_11170, partial [Gilliamella apis]|uniref:hypothetical protein n=1 Tax=Gilliamella apis TaxID=1970738 RepID=UPI000B713119